MSQQKHPAFVEVEEELEREPRGAVRGCAVMETKNTQSHTNQPPK